MHYHPTGQSSETDDSTSIDLNWHDERPDLMAQLSLAGNEPVDVDLGEETLDELCLCVFGISCLNQALALD